MQSSLRDRPPASPPSEQDELLERIQDRVLWLAMQIVHHANSVRPNPDRMKVGGHQTSSASVVTILTSLFFEYMRPNDRIAIKPHASPVYHAIQYLLGNLDREYLTRLRDFHGLQAYPSRTKDPDLVDFSTGSVGLGAIAPNFAALVQEYLAGRDLTPPTRAAGHRPRRGRDWDGKGRSRFISLAGDAELDEGTVWESIVEPQLAETPNVLWVVDLNRQSLDRIIPGIRVRMWRQMFAANGWRVIDAKYGARLEAAFGLPGGELLRDCIDEMPNETYQRLLRHPPEALREWLPRFSQHPADLAKLISHWDDGELRSLYANLGGHDFNTLRRAFAESDQAEQPCVVFAYTMKGWRLPSQGDPQNHSVLMSQRQMDQLQKELGIEDAWGGFVGESNEGRLCSERGRAVRAAKARLLEGGNAGVLGPEVPATAPALRTLGREGTSGDSSDAPNVRAAKRVPVELGRPYTGQMSTQQAFGIILVDIARELPQVAERIVTASPDVASSTNLGGWINKVSVWSRAGKGPIPEDREQRALQWRESQSGRHIELGISEANLFMLLGQLGLTKEMAGEVLYPIGTLYDPFVLRALEALLYNLYSGSRFIVVGTPSGVTLSREGGAHQSFLTPSVGLGLPDMTYYEPCFAQELEWVLLDAIEQVRIRRRSAYLRLSTKRIDQDAATRPEDTEARERLRRQVLNGGYRLVDLSGQKGYLPAENAVHILAAGSIVPEALAASRALLEQGVFANVVNVTSPGMLFQSYEHWKQDRLTTERRGPAVFADLVPEDERGAPVVTVVDGHPSALAWAGGALGCKVIPLGVSGFGQSGALAELYREYGIDAGSIARAALVALEG